MSKINFRYLPGFLVRLNETLSIKKLFRIVLYPRYSKGNEQKKTNVEKFLKDVFDIIDSLIRTRKILPNYSFFVNRKASIFLSS